MIERGQSRLLVLVWLTIKLIFTAIVEEKEEMLMMEKYINLQRKESYEIEEQAGKGLK